VVTALTRISAPVEDVWRVIVAFDQYSQWHPVLSLDAKSEQVRIGAQIPGRISRGDTGELDVTMRIVDMQAPRRRPPPTVVPRSFDQVVSPRSWNGRRMTRSAQRVASLTSRRRARCRAPMAGCG
jgi:hypothetical protein